MKILLVTAGTKDSGATERCVLEAEREIKKLGGESEIFRLRPEAVTSCSGCGGCKAKGRCIHEDAATALGDRVSGCDGYIFFTPVHFGGAAGIMKAALGRVFISKRADLEYKPASVVAVSRRGGNFTAIEEISRFFGFASMPYVPGNYPGVSHGSSGIEAEEDKEGLQTVRSIAANMTWLIKCINCAKDAGIDRPTPEPKIKTGFVR